MSITSKMNKKSVIPWTGPCGEYESGGVTQSLIGRYLCCKERFRVYAIEGLKPHPRFSAPMDFGNMWHACEEALARDHHPDTPEYVSISWEDELEKCVNNMLAQYPRDVEAILHWTGVCQSLFPVYVDHWSRHPDVQNRIPLLSEQKFDVPYKLPSGRTVRLRGKWDSVDLGGEDIWIQENKTKIGIDRPKITRQLSFDLQTMMYCIALTERLQTYAAKNSLFGRDYKGNVKGVRYSVVRRSSHKTAGSMMKKVLEDQENGRINEWFDRINMVLLPGDVDRFKRECLDPVLENMCDDYEWWLYCKQESHNSFDCSIRQNKHHPCHFRLPYGIYNPIYEGGFGDVDFYLLDGSEVGLQRVDTLFPELEDKCQS